LSEFSQVASQLHFSLFDEAKLKFNVQTMKAIEIMSPKFTSVRSQRCLMPFKRGECIRPRNHRHPDGLCKQCRSRNNSYCINGKEAYFDYWKWNPRFDDSVPIPLLKARPVTPQKQQILRRDSNESPEQSPVASAARSVSSSSSLGDTPGQSPVASTTRQVPSFPRGDTLEKTPATSSFSSVSSSPAQGDSDDDRMMIDVETIQSPSGQRRELVLFSIKHC